MFKVGQTVKCINSTASSGRNNPNLTVGKTYEIADCIMRAHTYLVVVVNDRNKLGWYTPARFEACAPKRLSQLLKQSGVIG